MYIYWEEIGRGHVQKVSEQDGWSIYCGVDTLGYDCLYIKIGTDLHLIRDSDEFTSGRPNLDSYDVGEFFTAVVKAVVDLVVKDHPDYIDLVKIQEQVLEPFWKDWEEKGYITD